MSKFAPPKTSAQTLLTRSLWRLPAIVAGLTLPLAVSALAAPISDRAIAQKLTQKSISGWSSVILKVSGPMTPQR